MKRNLPIDVPATSPYYDRLRSLSMQLDFCPYGSPEYGVIIAEINNVRRIAATRMASQDADMTVPSQDQDSNLKESMPLWRNR